MSFLRFIQQRKNTAGLLGVVSLAGVFYLLLGSSALHAQSASLLQAGTVTIDAQSDIGKSQDLTLANVIGEREAIVLLGLGLISLALWARRKLL